MLQSRRRSDGIGLWVSTVKPRSKILKNPLAGSQRKAACYPLSAVPSTRICLAKGKERCTEPVHVDPGVPINIPPGVPMSINRCASLKRLDMDKLCGTTWRNDVICFDRGA